MVSSFKLRKKNNFLIKEVVAQDNTKEAMKFGN